MPFLPYMTDNKHGSWLVQNHYALNLFFLQYEGKVKVLGIAYNRHETRHKQSSGRDLDRGWCHTRTSEKHFWSQPMDPRTEWQHTRMLPLMSLEPWAANQKSFKLVWRWHQLLSGFLPNGRLSRVSRRLSARSATFQTNSTLDKPHYLCKVTKALHHIQWVAKLLGTVKKS